MYTLPENQSEQTDKTPENSCFFKYKNCCIEVFFDDAAPTFEDILEQYNHIKGSLSK